MSDVNVLCEHVEDEWILVLPPHKRWAACHFLGATRILWDGSSFCSWWGCGLWVLQSLMVAGLRLGVAIPVPVGPVPSVCWCLGGGWYLGELGVFPGKLVLVPLAAEAVLRCLTHTHVERTHTHTYTHRVKFHTSDL